MASSLYIKNMVCGRCILVVKDVLGAAGLNVKEVNLGEAMLHDDQIDSEKRMAVEVRLQSLGFELLDDARSKHIERIKVVIIEKVHHSGLLDMKYNWSDLLSAKLNHDYNYLSSLFSSVEGVTIEQYIIRQKIEKAKELLFYNEKNLSEIAYLLGYSSVQHLSTQFKKVTGQTPREFKNSRLNDRKPIDAVQ